VSFLGGPEDAPVTGRAIDWNPDNLMKLGKGVARMRTIEDGYRRANLQGSGTAQKQRRAKLVDDG
jgi:hypothetical protein